MNFATAPAAIKAMFATAWGNTTKVIYDDESASPPDSDPWVRFNIRHVDGFQASMGDPGNNRHRRIGNITAQVFVPQGNASIQASQLAQQAADIFIGVTYQGITFTNTVAREIGNDGKGFYQINVTTSFRYDDLT